MTNSGLILALGAFDLFLLALCYWTLRASASHITRRLLFPVGAGLAGFVFQAFMFFNGAFLFLQLATIAGIFGLFLMESSKRRDLPES